MPSKSSAERSILCRNFPTLSELSHQVKPDGEAGQDPPLSSGESLKETSRWTSGSGRIMICSVTDGVELPIDGTLDLHTFHSGDVKAVVSDYLAACRERHIREVRIIHGKGLGTQREIVHRLLSKLPEVMSYRLADEAAGGWGATIVLLKKTTSG